MKERVCNFIPSWNCQYSFYTYVSLFYHFIIFLRAGHAWWICWMVSRKICDVMTTTVDGMHHAVGDLKTWYLITWLMKQFPCAATFKNQHTLLALRFPCRTFRWTIYLPWRNEFKRREKWTLKNEAFSLSGDNICLMNKMFLTVNTMKLGKN